MRLVFHLLAGGILVSGLWLYGVIGIGPLPAPGSRPPAPAGPVRPDVLLVGTSLTARGDWPEALRQRLAACAPGVTVERLARAGGASGWAGPALAERLRQPAPGIVVIELSTNDAALWHGAPLPVSRARHLRLITAAREAGSVVMLALLNPAYGRNALERPGEVRYRALYRVLAAETGAGLIDMEADWQRMTDAARATALPDGLHPTGAAMIDRVVPAYAAALAPLLCGG